MKCIYHADNDGECAAAIILKDFECEAIPINYKDELPLDKIDKDEKVFIVDFSLQKPGDWEKLLERTKDVVWIDHHKSAIEKPGPQHNLKGIRSTEGAGCELTWEYLHSTPMPYGVELTGDYDTWTKKHGEETDLFHFGLMAVDTKPEAPIWSELVGDNSKESVARVVQMGKTVKVTMDKENAAYLDKWGFETELDGHSAIACNKGLAGSQLFDSDPKDHDLMLSFAWDGKQWTVSIYTTNSEIDASKIAEKYGGGGHKGAAGFQCEELPFKRG